MYGTVGVKHASTLVSQFDKMVSGLPMREAVRYKEGNVKCSAGDMNVSPNTNIVLCYALSVSRYITPTFPIYTIHIEMDRCTCQCIVRNGCWFR